MEGGSTKQARTQEDGARLKVGGVEGLESRGILDPMYAALTATKTQMMVSVKKTAYMLTSCINCEPLPSSTPPWPR